MHKKFPIKILLDLSESKWNWTEQFSRTTEKDEKLILHLRTQVGFADDFQFSWLNRKGSQGISGFSSSSRRMKGKFFNRKFWTHKSAKRWERIFKLWIANKFFCSYLTATEEKSKEKLENSSHTKKCWWNLQQMFLLCWDYVLIFKKIEGFLNGKKSFPISKHIRLSHNRYLLNVEDIFF